MPIRRLVPVLILCAVCLAAGPARAADTIDNAFYTITLPDGWENVPQPQQAQGGVVTLFINKAKNCGINLSAMPQDASAADIMKALRTEMSKQGVRFGKQKEKDGFLGAPFKKGRVPGFAIIGANGQDAGMINIFGPSPEPVAEILDALKPKKSGIFPPASVLDMFKK